MKTVIAVLLAIALVGCATPADKRLNRISQLEAEITKSHDKGNLTDAEYLKLLMKANQARQDVVAEQQNRAANALMIYGAMQKQNQQPVYQPVQMKPLDTGTSCVSSPVGNSVYTDCY